MKHFYAILLIILAITKGHAEPFDFERNYINVGYQQGLGFKSPIVRPAIDFNSTLYVFFNAGLNYQFNYGMNTYAGLGLFTLVQLQYGYAFGLNRHLFRVRSDLPKILWEITDGDFIDKITKNISVGLFLEHTFDYPQKGTIVGISVCYYYSFNFW